LSETYFIQSETLLINHPSYMPVPWNKSNCAGFCSKVTWVITISHLKMGADIPD